MSGHLRSRLTRLGSFLILITLSCAPSERSSGLSILEQCEPAQPSSLTPFEFELNRLPDSKSFEVQLSFSSEVEMPVLLEGDFPGLSLEINGEKSKLEKDGLVFRSLFEPAESMTGEVSIELSACVSDQRYDLKRTAVVLGAVDERWNQAYKMPGLVNTAGWEDGASLSRDGQYFFVHSLVSSISCVLGVVDDDVEVYPPQHPTLNPHCAEAIGEWTAPSRPQFEGAERIATDGKLTHACPSFPWGGSLIEPLTETAFPPQSAYGFRRQPDGSYREAFPIFFEGSSGCVSPFGLDHLRLENGDEVLLYGFNNPNEPGWSALYWANLTEADQTLGDPISLGRFQLGEAQLSESFHFRVGDPVVNPENDLPFSEGNPNVFFKPGEVLAVFFDDDIDTDDYAGRHQLYVRLATGQSWSAPIELPSPVNSLAQESQPFFHERLDGKRELFFRRGSEIYSSRFEGADLSLSESWELPVLQIRGEPLAKQEGSLIAVGEPSVAILESDHEVMAFIYVLLRYDSSQKPFLELNVGLVDQRDSSGGL